ncbi:efflux RND transporter periplasmic adaptor subunit [Thiomonas sp. FB-Cd]|uniref:efflux RND transporter periplasmic adaptor subunit n=1 Tax=Thiomonas sp. FB-Cd TaxID=1158292 RepID=UPI0004DF85F9|nr:efflux RND transporter periplasmic adaptor subunit [Thiomonas sp. FB-Cd]
MTTRVTTASTAPARKRKLWYLLLISILLIAGGLWLHLHRLHQADASPPAMATPWAVQTGTVGHGVVANSLQSVATVEAPNVITLSPQIQGTVTFVGPRSGVAVKRGELLARIDSRAIASNIAALEQQRIAARANADYAAKQQARTDAVLAEGGVSQAQADQARTATDAARASVQALSDQIAALRVNLGYAEIRAPQNAVVAQRLVEVGDTAAAGKPVYQLTAGQGAVVRVSLPADQLAEVKPDDSLRLHQGGASLTLPISRIAPAVNAAGLGTVEADAPSSPFGLPSGSSVAATIALQSQAASTLTVPAAAVVGSGDHAHVVAFNPGAKAGEPGRLRIVPVKVLQEGANAAAVSGSLQPGEQVVVGQTAVLAQMRDGDAAVTATAAGAAQ